MILSQRIFKNLFWAGYLLVLVSTFIPITGDLDKVKLGPESFHIRLDHLLHLLVYFLICMYYLFGQEKGLNLFDSNPLRKFILLILILATVTEVIQLWVPERTFNVFDLVSNVGRFRNWGRGYQDGARRVNGIKA